MIKDYVFKGFGFDILIINAPVKEYLGEECLDINMKELEQKIVLQLLKSNIKLSGPEIKFLRRHVKLSTAQVSEGLSINESNLKYWEKENKTGLTETQEYAFRLIIVDEMAIKMKKDLLKPTSLIEAPNHKIELKYA